MESGATKSVIRMNFDNETYSWDSDLKNERGLQKGISVLEKNVAYVFGGDGQDGVETYSYKEKSWKKVKNLAYSKYISTDYVNSFSVAQDTLELYF